jgi:hypothetical protein
VQARESTCHHERAGGQVVYTGTSSIDIRLVMQQHNSSQPNLVALFTFVARDPTTGKATPVNPLVPGTKQEKGWYREREEIALARKAARMAGAEYGQPPGGAAVAWAQSLMVEAEVLRVMPGAPSPVSALCCSTFSHLCLQLLLHLCGCFGGTACCHVPSAAANSAVRMPSPLGPCQQIRSHVR